MAFFKDQITNHITVLTLCFSLFTNPAWATTEPPDLVVDEQWLMQHIDDTDLVIIDARSEEKYSQGHIKGAISLPSSKTFSPFPPTDRLAPEAVINKLFGAAGISNDSMVVIYDDGPFKFAARVVWAFHVNGHKNVAILSTDYPSWKALDLPTTTTPTILAATTFNSQLQPQRFASSFQTLLATKNANVTIVDVREQDEYRGERSRSRRYGHIPNAISINWHDMADSKGDVNRLKSTDELRTLFNIIDPGDSVITYCQKGHEAALAYIALSMMGHDTRVYDGSWHEWGNSTNLPVEGPDDSPAIPKNIE